MRIDAVEFIDGRTGEKLPMPSNVLSSDSILSAGVEKELERSGNLIGYRQVFRIVVKPGTLEAGRNG